MYGRRTFLRLSIIKLRVDMQETTSYLYLGMVYYQYQKRVSNVVFWLSCSVSPVYHLREEWIPPFKRDNPLFWNRIPLSLDEESLFFFGENRFVRNFKYCTCFVKLPNYSMRLHDKIISRL